MKPTSPLPACPAAPRLFRRIAPLAAMAVIAAVMVGCEANPRVTQERNALYKQNQELQGELNRARAALDDSESNRSALQDRINELQNKLAAKPAPASAPPPKPNGFTGISGVQTFQGNGYVTVRVPGDVLFASGKAKLRSSSKKTLKQIADVIQNQYGGDTVRVEGYTDSVPIKKSHWHDNLDLSMARAAAVYRYLQQEGVASDRMYAAGYGATHPRGTKAKSRRVEIVVVRK